MTLSDIMRDVKSYTAKQIRETLCESGSVWQTRFHDRGIRTEIQFLAAVDYIHQNPVKAALAESAEGYDFSSARAYSGWAPAGLAVDLLDGSRLGP